MSKIHNKDTILHEVYGEIKNILGDQLETITIERAVVGIFFIGVKLSNGDGGVSFTPIKSIPEAVCCPSTAFAMPSPGKIKGQKATHFLKDIDSPVPIKKSFAVAVLNALTTTCWNMSPSENYVIEKSIDPIDVIDIPNDASVTLVGAITPYLKRFKKGPNPFTVLEYDPRALKEDELPFYKHGDYAHEVIPESDIVMMTGTTLLNETVHDLLSYCKEDAQVVVVGPTSSMFPIPLFRRGVNVVGGIRVTKPDEILDILSEGGSGYHFFGKSAEKILIRSTLS